MCLENKSKVYSLLDELKIEYTSYDHEPAFTMEICKEIEKVIGYILFKEFSEGVYEIGWIFNKDFWNQGYAFESCKAVIGYAFHSMNVHKIFAETIDGVKSVRLMKKLGMKLEGIQRSQTKDNFGNWADLYFYGILAEDRQ